MKKLLPLLLTGAFTTALLFTMTGCGATVDITKTGKGFQARTNPNEVEIFKTRPDKAFDELGIVSATNFEPDETARMHNAIRAKAADLGANAVILTEEGFLPNAKKWANGVAIRYK